jgi:hypothetical protein
MASARRWQAIVGSGVLALCSTLPAIGAAAPPPPSGGRALARCQQTVSGEGLRYSVQLGWRLARCLRAVDACGGASCAADVCRGVADAASLEARLRARIDAACAGVPLDQLTSGLGFAPLAAACPFASLDGFAGCLALGLREAAGAVFGRLEPMACQKLLALGAVSPVPAECCDASALLEPSTTTTTATTTTTTATTAPVGLLYCGGAQQVACPPGFVCDRTDPLCTLPDAAGQCAPVPTSCPAGTPVCGCDGTTYASDCARLAAGVTKMHDGACDPAPPALCSSNADCGAGFFCEFAPGSCGEGGPGTCAPKRSTPCDLCAAFVDGPVCGCDLVTYPTQCARQAAGVAEYFVGSCF